MIRIPTEIFDDANEQLLEIIKQNNVKTDFWLGFSNKHFEGLSDEAKLEKAVASVSYIQNRAKELGCTVSLYNHGDWFGEPENQIKIIEKMGAKDVGIVYNFHHAHLQIKEFPQLLQKMLPYLNTVNLNGMKVEGPKILTIGKGDEELGMLNTLKESVTMEHLESSVTLKQKMQRSCWTEISLGLNHSLVKWERITL